MAHVARALFSIRRGAALAVACLAFSAIVPPALAQDLAAARKAFKEGDEAEKRRDLPVALEKFKLALTVKETPQLILRIGGVEEKLGLLGQAVASYEKGYERAQAQGLAPVAKVAKEQMDALRPRVPTVVVTIAKKYADLSVKLDDKPLALGTKIYLDPGDHRIIAEATGYERKEKPFAAIERDQLEFQLDLAPVGSPTGPVPVSGTGAPSGDNAKPTSKAPAAILIAGGGAAIVGGVVLFLVASSKNSTIDTECGGSNRLMCPKSQEASINSQISSVKLFQILSAASAGVGVAGVGIGTYLLLRKPPAPASSSAFQVVPVFGPSVGGLSASGSF